LKRFIGIVGDILEAIRGKKDKMNDERLMDRRR